MLDDRIELLMNSTLAEGNVLDPLEIKDSLVEVEFEIERTTQNLSNMVANRFDHMINIHKQIDQLKHTLNQTLEVTEKFKKNILLTTLKPLENQFYIVILNNRKNNLQKLQSLLILAHKNLRLLKILGNDINSSNINGMHIILLKLEHFISEYPKLTIAKFIQNELDRFKIRIRDLFLTDICCPTNPILNNDELLPLFNIYENIGLLDRFAGDLVSKLASFYEIQLVELLKRHTIYKGLIISVPFTYESSNIIYDHIPSYNFGEFINQFILIAVSAIKKYLQLFDGVTSLLSHGFVNKFSSQTFQNLIESSFNENLLKFILRDLNEQIKCVFLPFEDFVVFAHLFESIIILKDVIKPFNVEDNLDFQNLISFTSTSAEKQLSHLMSQISDFTLDCQYTDKESKKLQEFDIYRIENSNNKIFIMPDGFTLKRIKSIENHSVKNLFNNILNCFLIILHSCQFSIPLFYAKSFIKMLEDLIENSIFEFTSNAGFEKFNMHSGQFKITNELFEFDEHTIKFIYEIVDSFVPKKDSKYHHIDSQNDFNTYSSFKSLKHSINHFKIFQNIIDLSIEVFKYLSNEISLNSPYIAQEIRMIDSSSFHDFSLANILLNEHFSSQISRFVFFYQIKGFLRQIFIDFKIKGKISSINWMVEDLPSCHSHFIDDIAQIATKFKEEINLLEEDEILPEFLLNHTFYDFIGAIFCHYCSLVVLDGFCQSSSMCNSGGSAQRQLDILALKRILYNTFSLSEIKSSLELSQEFHKDCHIDHDYDNSDSLHTLKYSNTSHIIKICIKRSIEYVQHFTKALYLSVEALKDWLHENRENYSKNHLESLINSIVFLSRTQKSKMIKELQ